MLRLFIVVPKGHTEQDVKGDFAVCILLLLLSCAKSRMLSPSRRQPHLLHVSVADRRQTWSMDKS